MTASLTGGFASLYRRELEAVSLISCEYIVLFFNALDIYFDIFFHDVDVIDHTWKVIIMQLLTSIPPLNLQTVQIVLKSCKFRLNTLTPFKLAFISIP